MVFSPTSIDLSQIPLPNAIETLDYETLLLGFKDRFQISWDAARLIDLGIPVYDVSGLETDPVIIAGQASNYLRFLDRQRVNDAIKAVLAPYAKKSDLDAVVAGANVQRLVITPADGDTPAVMESDVSMLLRYLLAFDKPSAGSSGRYLFEAWTAWPLMGDARVNGHAIHGRRGDSDVVIIGRNGDLPTSDELKLVSDSVLAAHVKPEAINVSAIAATRSEYEIDFTIVVPSGPDAELVRLEAEKRVKLSSDLRTTIGGEIPQGLLAGAAYGPNIIRVRDNSPVLVLPDPYTVPVLSQLSISVEVLQ